MFNNTIGHYSLTSFISKIDFWIGTVLATFLINSLGLVLPIFIIQIYDRVITNKSKQTLYVFFMIACCALVLEFILKVLRGYIITWYEARFSYKAINYSVEHTLYSDLKSYRTIPPSQHLSNINAVDTLSEVYSGSNITLFCDGPFIFVYLLLLYMIHPFIAGVLAVVVIGICVYNLYDYKELVIYMILKKNNMNSKTKFLVEVLTGIHTVKSLGLEEQLLRRYEKLEKKNIKDSYDMIQKQLASGRVMTLFSQLILVTTVITGTLLYFRGSISVGGMAASVLISGKLMQPLSKFISFALKVAKGKLAQEDADNIFSLELEEDENKKHFDIEEGGILLKNVTFGYKEKDIFNKVNLCIPPKTTVAIHGDGLIGKTTLLNLISGLYKPSNGEICVDGNNLLDLDIEYYRKQIAYMSDTGTLFQGSIQDNITMFDDEYNDLVSEVCSTVGVLKTIENMSQGFKTEVGKGAVDFISKGDKQRIIMARSVLNEPKIILFDEANAALDKDSDKHLISFIKSYVGKCTIVLISHRPSINNMANLHFKIENRKILNVGSSYAK